MRMTLNILISLVVLFSTTTSYAQESRDSVLHIVKEKYYSKGLIIDKEVIRKKALQYIYFDKIKSIDNIIRIFGKYHFLKTYQDRRAEIDHYINFSLIDTSLTFGEYFDSLLSLSVYNFDPKYQYPTKYFWNEFLTFHFPYDSIGSIWVYTNSREQKLNFNNIFADSIGSDGRKYCSNIDSIVEVLENSMNGEIKPDYYFKLFLNLTNKGFDHASANQALFFNKKLLQVTDNYDVMSQEQREFLPLDTTPSDKIVVEEDFITDKPGTIVIGSFTDGYYPVKQVINSKGDTSSIYVFLKDYEKMKSRSLLETPFFENPAIKHREQFKFNNPKINDETKIYWILGTIKNLMTSGTRYAYNVSRYFGYIYAILDQNEELKDKHYLLIRNLEVQFLHILSRRIPREVRFAKDAIKILQVDEAAHLESDTSVNRYFIQNFLLVQQLLDIWNLRQTLDHDYGELYRLQSAQTLLNAFTSFNSCEFETESNMKWNFYLLEEVREYNRLNYDFQGCVAVDLNLLKLIDENKKYFSKQAFNKVVQNLHSDLGRAGMSKERKLLWQSIEFPVSLNSFENLNKKIQSKEDYLTMSARYFISAAANLNYASNPEANEIPPEFLFVRPSVKKSPRGRIPEIHRPQIISLLKLYEKDLISRGFYKKAIRIIHYRESIEARYLRNTLKHYERIEKVSVAGNKLGVNSLIESKKKQLQSLNNRYDSILSLYGDEIQRNHQSIAGITYELKDSINRLKMLQLQIANLENYKRRLLFEVDSNIRIVSMLQDVSDSLRVDLGRHKDTIAIKDTVIVEKTAEIGNLQGESQIKDEKLEERKFAILLILGVLFVFSLLILRLIRQRARLREQKEEIIKQRIISDSLRFGFGQFSHAARNTIGGFNAYYISKIPDSLSAEVLKIKSEVFQAVDSTANFLDQFDLNNKEGRAFQSLVDDIHFGADWAQMEFGRKMTGNAIDQISFSSDELSDVMVPIYTVANIIHNSFKYTSLNDVRITITASKLKDSVILCIQDVGAKGTGAGVSTSTQHGTTYILRALEAYNGSDFDTNYQAEMSEQNDSYKTTFNLKIKR